MVSSKKLRIIIAIIIIIASEDLEVQYNKKTRDKGGFKNHLPQYWLDFGTSQAVSGRSFNERKQMYLMETNVLSDIFLKRYTIIATYFRGNLALQICLLNFMNV